MRITKILIEAEIEEKILKKHGIRREQIEEELLEGNPRFFRTRDNKYMALTHKNQYLTIIFEYNKPNAVIKTAYRSAEWQIRRYNKK